MKHVKSALALVLTLFFIVQMPAMIALAAEIQHPRVVPYGQVTKIVYSGRNVFEYKDDQGLSSTLPFERQNENITIPFYNIVFEKNFENKTIAEGTLSSSSELDVTRDVLTSNGIEYVLLKATNKTALSADTVYYARVVCQTDDIPITADSYLLVTLYVHIIGDNLVATETVGSVLFDVVDTGGANRAIGVIVREGRSDDGIEGTEGSAYSAYDSPP